MHIIDLIIFGIYFSAMLYIGYYFLRKNETEEDYYVGSRNLSSWHVGLSVVATDVGGGFSIGLGGLGFAIGIAGSWLLFTGLVGAWIAAVLLIPKVWSLAHKKNFLTFPQLFEHFYNKEVALLAGIISAIGYIGFTSSQMLAGAKLADAAFKFIDQTTAVYIMGIIIVGYTAMGGLKAVVFTDTIQWSVLIIGLTFIGIPAAYYLVGGWTTISATLKDEYFSLTNVSWQQIINWIVTIVPIWFVGMTLYQRIYATKNTKDAQKAWFIAGLFEWPVMAFMGVTLGLLARVAADTGMFTAYGFSDPASMDAELGLPLLLVHVLPVGLLGIMMSAYFSAIMSTADSCLMAASGNVLTDIVKKISPSFINEKNAIKGSQLITLILGGLALLIAVKMSNVLELMLYSYAFMVSGLFIPVIAALYIKKPGPMAAFLAMLAGGSTTITLILLQTELPWGLDPNVFGISASALIFFMLNYILPNNHKQ
ncbi:MAG: sodium:solute symporter family protein [Bacteroidales bacterium]|nr:sodium:solute symporter family protein [Bacteroidales bacterium]